MATKLEFATCNECKQPTADPEHLANGTCQRCDSRLWPTFEDWKQEHFKPVVQPMYVGRRFNKDSYLTEDELKRKWAQAYQQELP